MKRLFQTRQFVKDVKRMAKQGKDLDKLKTIVSALAEDKALSSSHRDHPLAGKWKGCRDCHVEPDWVLIYSTDETFLRLERTGSHSDLFE